LSAPIP